MTDAPQQAPANDQIVIQWQTIISTQMHFNDMILRTRAIGSSVVLAVYGYAFVSLVQYPNAFIPVFSHPFHISFLIICFALSMLSSFILMDVFYYYRLLLGMVKIGAKFEKENPSLVDQTNQLGNWVSLWWANFVVGIFYLIPGTIGGYSLLYIFTNYTPTFNVYD